MQKHHHYTLKIVIGMILGIAAGLCLQYFSFLSDIRTVVSVDIFGVLGQIFIRLMKMLVVPIVFVSLVCGVMNLTNIRSLGSIGIKAIALYLFTTAVAISLAICFATAFNVGHGLNVQPATDFVMKKAPAVKTVLLDLFPVNPMNALAEGNMLQIIIFALLLGAAMVMVKDKSKKLADVFESANEVLMKLIMVIMELAPYGVFFLLASLFTRMQLADVLELVSYFATVIVVLIVQFAVVYSFILWALTRKNPIWFIRGIYPAMIFAFSVSSSNVSIPVTLQTVKQRLNVPNPVASFVIPLGATINMDGTAIMQGVATVFIAHAYHVSLGIGSYLTVIGMATLASIGTAGVPGVGLITLAMVLQQVGLPVEGIALIIGVDRLLDMARTAVNVAGDAMVSVIAAKT